MAGIEVEWFSITSQKNPECLFGKGLAVDGTFKNHLQTVGAEADVACLFMDYTIDKEDRNIGEVDFPYV